MNSHCMCRVCETVHDLKNLFDEENEELLHMLRCIANISVKKDDLLPKEICNYCAYRLQMAYDFKIQCEITDQTLRRMFENVEVKFATLQHLSDNNVSKQVPKKLFIDPTACDFIKEEEPESIDDHILNTVSNLDQNIAKEEYISNSELIGVLDSEINNRIDEERDLGHIENADVELIEENYCNELQFMQPSKDAESSGSGNGDDPDAELLEEDDIIERLEEEFMDQLNDMENSKDVVSLLVDSSMSQEQDAVQPVGADMVELVAASETDSNHVSSTSEVKSTNPARRQNNKTFICPWCSATFTVYTEFNAHKKTHGRPRFQCTICGKTCARRSGLKDHIATHSGANKIQCHLCSKQCSNRGNLYRHINQCHEKIKPHSCEVCGACFSRKSGVREHALTHSEIRNFSCDICDKKFKTLVYLNTHKRTHMPVEERRKLPRAKPPKRQLYVCEHCGKKSYTLATHITHKKIHSDVKRFVCELCQKGFHFKNTLLTHMLCHTGEKPYTCDICGKGFRQIAHLNTHKLAVHEQARRHKCQYCGKAFTSSGTLKVHERIHTGEKPYECELCESRYIDANGLRKHRQKIHADVYQQPTKTAYPIKLVGEDTMHATVFDEESLVAICENEIGELSMDQGVVDQLNVYLDEMHQGYTEVIESET